MTPHVVIVGAGFGGLAAARALAHAPVRITLVDRENHHLFQPLLYQVAIAALSASDIAAPSRAILRHQRNVSVLLAEAEAIDLGSRRVILDAGELHYDYLVVAAGAETSYFGNDGWADVAPGLKRLDDALEIRRRVLLAYEIAEREGDERRRHELLHFAVVGGGPTGAELAGAIAELGHRVMVRDFRHIDPRATHVTLLEAGPRILPAFAPELSEKAEHQLRELGVEVLCNARVVHIDAHGVRLATGDSVTAATCIWAAGVQPVALAQTLDAPRDRAGRVRVERDLSIPGHPEAFAIGDLARFEQDGEPLPGLSPVAKQEGVFAARVIAASVRDGRRPVAEFRYFDKGTMATIGRARAVAQLRGLRMSGWVAWYAWLFVHILYLIGFRNRVVVLITWAWSYFTFKLGARLITGDEHPPRPLAAIAIDGERRPIERAAPAEPELSERT